jgi:hypothetical protein
MECSARASRAFGVERCAAHGMSDVGGTVALVSDAELELQLDAYSDQLSRLGAEADRRLTDVSRRLDNSATRAAFIMSSAVVLAGVQLSRELEPWIVGSIVAAFAASVLALPLLLFVRRRELNIAQHVRDLALWSPRRLELEIINVKVAVIAEEERALRLRGNLLRWSLIALTLALALGVTQFVSTLIR